MTPSIEARDFSPDPPNRQAKLDTSSSQPEVDNSPPAMNTSNPESIHISKLRKMAWEMENVGFAYVKSCRHLQYVYEKWIITIAVRIGDNRYFICDFIDQLECEKIWTHIKIKKIRQIEERIKDIAKKIIDQQYQKKLNDIENIQILP